MAKNKVTPTGSKKNRIGMRPKTGEPGTTRKRVKVYTSTGRASMKDA